jgi:serine/threonine protein kinase
MAVRPPEPSTPPPPPPAYRTLASGRYVLVRKLAEGGTAIVHLGYDTVEQQCRAVKELLPEYAKRPALRHRFEREGETMRELRHPNIVRVYDAGSEDETAFLVMEFAEAGSVIDWVEKNGPMPPRMAGEVGLALCAGIQAAHEEGIIHRDIKPQNLLVDRNGVCKVTDFGIAQVVQETRMTMTGTVMGTIGYMAPEQHESAKHADERADVYSIAATLYTLIKGETATHLFMADERDFEGLPGPIAEVVRRGSQYRREARYGTVAEMAKALRAAIDQLPQDPVDVPPLVAPDLRTLDEVTPPTFTSTINPLSAPRDGSRRVEARGRSGPLAEGWGSLEPSGLLLDSSGDAPSRDTVGRDPVEIVPVPPPTPSSIIPRRSVSDSASGQLRQLRGERYVPAREAQQRQQRLLKIGAAVLGVALFLTFSTSVMVVVTGTQIDRLAKQESVTERLMYEQFHEEMVLVDALADVDPRTAEELRLLFQQIEREDDPDARDGAASRLVALLQQKLHELRKRDLTSEQFAVKQLQESLRRLEERRAAWLSAKTSLDAERATWSGTVWTVLWGE